MARTDMLTERDRELLYTLGRYGYMYLQDTRHIYNSSHYFRNRISVLAKRRILTRKNSIIYLAKAGRGICEREAIPCNSFYKTDRQRNICLAASHVAINIGSGKYLESPWQDIYSRWEVKAAVKENNPGCLHISPHYLEYFDDNDMYILCGIAEGGRGYLIYVTGKSISLAWFKRFTSEMNKFSTTPFNRAIVFTRCKASEAEKLSQYIGGMAEVISIPYDDDYIDIARQAGSSGFDKKLCETAFGYGYEITDSELPVADFAINDNGRKKHVAVLALNDLVKRVRLESYYANCAISNIKPAPIVVICFNEQLNYFKPKYQLAEFRTIDINDIIKTESGKEKAGMMH